MNTTDQTTHLFTTLPALLAHQASACADSPAIEAPGREALTYQGLWEHVASIGDNLKTAGVCPTDRIALLLPNGPEMAVAFLAASGVACAAPLNPAYRSRELEFYFTDLPEITDFRDYCAYADSVKFARFANHLRDFGVYISPSNTLHNCSTLGHSDKEVEVTVKAFAEALKTFE